MYLLHVSFLSPEPRSFWPVAGIESSGFVQHRKSAIHWLPVKSGKSDWLGIWNEYSAHDQKIGFGQSSRSLLQVRRIVALGTRMLHVYNIKFCHSKGGSFNIKYHIVLLQLKLRGSVYRYLVSLIISFITAGNSGAYSLVMHCASQLSMTFPSLACAHKHVLLMPKHERFPSN